LCRKPLSTAFSCRPPSPTQPQRHFTTNTRSWQPDEDKLIVQLVRCQPSSVPPRLLSRYDAIRPRPLQVERYGPKKWTTIACHLNERTGKQCRERWAHHLDPNINKAPWSSEEDRIILEANAKHGNRWALISKLLPGRTDNSVKNRWNSNLSKRARPLMKNCDLVQMPLVMGRLSSHIASSSPALNGLMGQPAGVSLMGPGMGFLGTPLGGFSEAGLAHSSLDTPPTVGAGGGCVKAGDPYCRIPTYPHQLTLFAHTPGKILPGKTPSPLEAGYQLGLGLGSGLEAGYPSLLSAVALSSSHCISQAHIGGMQTPSTAGGGNDWYTPAEGEGGYEEGLSSQVLSSGSTLRRDGYADSQLLESMAERRPLKRRRVGILRQRVERKAKGPQREEETKGEDKVEEGAIAALKSSPAYQKMDSAQASASESPRLKRFAPALCALVSAVSEEGTASGSPVPGGGRG